MKLPASFDGVLDMGKSIKEYFQTKKTSGFRDFLHDLENASISLSSEQKKLLKYVFKEAERQVFKDTKRKKGNDDKMSTLNNEDKASHKLAVVTKNLQIILQKFEMCKKAKVKFVREYPTWKEKRSENIKSLKEIGESIHHDRQNSNISTLVATCTQAVGGALLTAAPFTGALAIPTAVAAGAAVALGAATSIGTSITETTLLQKKITKAKAIVEEDKLSFEVLKDLLIRANCVYEALNAILSIDVDNSVGKEKLFKIIKEFASLAIQMSKSARKNNTLVKKFVTFASENLSPQFHLMTIFPQLLGLLGILALQCDISQTVFSLAFKTWEIVTNNIIPIATASLYLLQPALTSITSDAINASTRGFVAGIGISLDVARIILTAIDVHNGSVSEEGQKIIEAANEMEKEAGVLETVYMELKPKI